MGGFVPVRVSHLLRHCSVGAIVREGDRIVVVPDTRHWYSGTPPPSSEIRYAQQVKKSMGIESRLCMPPTATLDHDGTLAKGKSIRAERFPSWTSCAKCGLLQRWPWSGDPSSESLSCGLRSGGECDGRLEQVPWVLVHEYGHLADVPWHRLAHSALPGDRESRCDADPKQPHLLRLEDSPEGRRVRCLKCNAWSKLSDRLPYPSRAWQQPWIRSPPPDQLEVPGWLLEINDVRIHTPVTGNAIVIPPESRIRKGTVRDRLYSNSNLLERIRKARPGLQRRSAVHLAASELRCTEERIEAALADIARGYPLYGKPLPDGDLLAGEFEALRKEPTIDFLEDEEFVTRHKTGGWRVLRDRLTGHSAKVAAIVTDLVRVERLKEIVVLRGFTRLGNEKVIPPDITGEMDWLPAVALRGEGVFFALDETLLRRWANQKRLHRKTERLSVRLDSHPLWNAFGQEEVTSQFILLHTLAHLVIRHLAPESGYPTAALKERIYCASRDKPMAGILIYVAVADDVGSLGGLVQLAEPRRFLRILTAALESATWCSFDPVCSEHEGQGPGLLNGAACQGCSLVPDPTCAFGNVLLDRTYIKGNTKAGVAPLLDFVGGNR